LRYRTPSRTELLLGLILGIEPAGLDALQCFLDAPDGLFREGLVVDGHGHIQQVADNIVVGLRRVPFQGLQAAFVRRCKHVPSTFIILLSLDTSGVVER
jgi:hypothetical protein